MVASLSAQIALLTFSLAVLAGLYAGNSPSTILLRAVIAMLLALLAARAVGLAAKVVLRDHLLRAKQRIDSEHMREVAPPAGASRGD